jgi:DNA-binding beta-propeller fold protein YncE
MVLIVAPLLLALLLGGSALADPAGAANYHELARLHFGGEGSWDYLIVDSSARRLYISRANRVMVVDVESGKLVGEVEGLDGAHGVVVVKERGLGFASSGKSGEVVSFDLKTLKVVKRVKTGENPDAILFDRASGNILAFNGRSKSVSAVDPVSLQVVGTLSLPGKPEFAVDGEAGRVFVNVEDKSELLALDPVQMKILATYPLKPCEEPTGLSMDTASQRLIVGCGNRLAVIVDASTGRVTQSFKVGGGVDATAFDSDRKLAFVSAGEGRLTVLSEDRTEFHLLQDLVTIQGARTLAVDAKTGHVFLPNAQFKSVASAQQTQGHVRPSVVPGTFGVLVVGTN